MSEVRTVGQTLFGQKLLSAIAQFVWGSIRKSTGNATLQLGVLRKIVLSIYACYISNERSSGISHSDLANRL